MDPIDLVLIGAGGHGAELLSYLMDLRAAGQPVNLLGVVDEGKPVGPWEGTHVLGDFADLARLLGSLPRSVHYLTAVGQNATRQALVRKAEAAGAITPWTLRHPSAQVGRSVEIGGGSCLAPNSVVTTRVRVGRHCILNVKASVSHDCTVGDYANINPNATVCGNVRIGEGAFIGAGATISNGVSVGAWSIIGAGAVVIRDIPAHVTAVGVPARVIKHHPSQEKPCDA
jgi:sugar O-acyltransferase (sialic acid O-acetyltransferase NeuD family)